MRMGQDTENTAYILGTLSILVLGVSSSICIPDPTLLTE